MNSPTPDMNFSTGWGPPKRTPSHGLYLCLIEILVNNAEWRVSPFTPLPEPPFSGNFLDQLRNTTKRVIVPTPLPTVIESRKALLKAVYEGPRPRVGNLAGASDVFHGLDMDLEINREFVEAVIPVIADYLLGDLGQALTMVKELHPYSIHPSTQRGERTLQRRRLSEYWKNRLSPKVGQPPAKPPTQPGNGRLPVQTYGDLKAKEAETWDNLAADLVWDPTALMLLIPKGSLRGLMADQMGTLMLREVRAASHGEDVFLLPFPYGDINLLGPTIDLKATLPLAPFGGVPTLEVIQQALTETSVQSPMRRDLERFLQHLSPGGDGHPHPRFWTLEEDLDRAADV